MAKIIGLTGGIGSGKTSVLHLFAARGVPYYIADIRAKQLMERDNALRDKIVETFGTEAYRDDGSLHTAYLAEMVFNDPVALQKLNALVHPVVHEDFKRYAAGITAPYLLYENAVLYESGADAFCDAVIFVSAPLEERIRRVINRDGTTGEQVKARIRNQWDEEKKKNSADYIIVNTDWEQTKVQVEALHRKLLKLSKE